MQVYSVLLKTVQVYSVLPGGCDGPDCCDGRLPDLPWEGGRKNMVSSFVKMGGEVVFKWAARKIW